MRKDKPASDGHTKKHTTVTLVRSSAAEYLTFVAAGGNSEASVEMRYEDENIWLTQKMMAALYDVSVPAINQHLKRIFNDNELEESSVVKQYLTTAADGKGYQTKHYSLQAIIAVGFKIENERKFYQKITDIYATSIDYDITAQSTKRFFATVQNKLNWAIHGQTASEVRPSQARGGIRRGGRTIGSGPANLGDSSPNLASSSPNLAGMRNADAIGDGPQLVPGEPAAERKPFGTEL